MFMTRIGGSFAALLSAASFWQGVSAQADGEYPFDVTTIVAPDNSISASFVSIGAALTQLWVPDRNGLKRDVILGYDDQTQLLNDPAHPYFNGIVGRYANRIKNGTFSIPITKEAQEPGPGVYQILTNEHDGQVTLHGGVVGWDRKNWTLTESSPNSVTYKHLDTADQGFPGNVTAFMTHTLENDGAYQISIRAEATELTPILLSQHVYWNLDAYQGYDANGTVLPSHHMVIPSDRVLRLDGNGIPTGEFIEVEGTPFDFRNDTGVLQERWNQTVDNCGTGCAGFDHTWIYTNPNDTGARTSLWSDASGIRLDVYSDQPALQVYTTGNLGTLNIPRKAIHGGANLTYGSFSAVVLEQEGWIDAINTPEFNVDQIYGPDRPYDWNATYVFSLV